MKVYDNGVYRDATPEEEERINQQAGDIIDSLEDRVKILEDELVAAKIMLGEAE